MAAIKYNKKRSRTHFADTAKRFEKRVEHIYRQNYHTQLERIVAPFESDIQFNYQRIKDGDDIVYGSEAADNIATINASGDAITSAELFTFLDEGTDSRYVILPSNFQNETTPDSLETFNATYDRDEIYITKVDQGGIEARRFVETLIRLKEADTGRQIKTAAQLLYR